jgi:FkbM family methyltransferase
MKKIIHRAVNKLGYILLKREYMPNGISLSRDVSKDNSTQSIATIFDVGASIGEMSLYFSENFEQAKIYAFEPVSSSYSALCKNTHAHSRISPINIGFSNQSGKVKVYLQKDHGLNSINSNVNIPDEKNQGKFEEVEIDTIDNYCKNNKIEYIDILKTDAEGIDLLILKGAENMIKERRIKYILSESGFHPDNKRNTPFDELKEYLFAHNYKIKAFYDQSDYGKKPYITCANTLFLLQESK